MKKLIYNIEIQISEENILNEKHIHEFVMDILSTTTRNFTELTPVFKADVLSKFQPREDKFEILFKSLKNRDISELKEVLNAVFEELENRSYKNLGSQLQPNTLSKVLAPY